jgi:hypothetical protein
MMEQYLRGVGKGMSRQTIHNYKKRLEDFGLIDTRFGDYVYYKVFKRYGVQEQEEITKEEYSKAWKLYWEFRNANPDADSTPAYSYMYSQFGGVPRKQHRIQQNGIYKQENNILFDLASKSILEEIDG